MSERSDASPPREMRPSAVSSALVPVASVLGACALALGVMALVLGVAGTDVGRAFQALWSGSLGSWYALTSSTLVRAIPLGLAGLAVALAFRAGVWNIGAEGQLLAGAAVACAVGLSWSAALGALVLLPVLLLGAIAGGCWAGIAAVLRRTFGVREVISTIMLNFVALSLVGYLVRGPLQEPQRIYPQSTPIPDVAQLPPLFAGTRLHWGMLIVLVAALLLWWFLRATASGFRVRLVGQNPDAAREAGCVDVEGTVARTFVVSGMLAGLAGAVELSGVTFALYENISPGYGYTAIAVALLARLHPIGVLGTAVLFGALRAGALSMQREAAVPAVLVSVVEGLLILLILAGTRWRALGSLRLPRLSTRGAISTRVESS
ncbi:MAG TPA: ABC transporter permease [Gemmatimonadaceae bacterium]|nr:ABC transporter permease [Gemmatimonadaceae bacterium]